MFLLLVVLRCTISMQVSHHTWDLHGTLNPAEDSRVALDAMLRGSMAEASSAAADERQPSEDDDRAVFMQGSIVKTKEKTQAHVNAHSKVSWEWITENLANARLVGNSSVPTGLKALVNEAKLSEMSINEWRRMAFQIASLRRGALLNASAGPSSAFPARHVASRPWHHSEQSVLDELEAVPDLPESFAPFPVVWRDAGLICTVGLCIVMFAASVIMSNSKKNLRRKTSLLLEFDSHSRLTGSSDMGGLALLRQAADAQQQEVPTTDSGQEFGVWDGTVVVFSAIVGTGLLAMPYAFSLAGFIAVPLILVFVCCAAYTSHLMVWSMQAEAARKCIPSCSKAAREVALDWGCLVQSAFGKKAQAAVECFLIVELWGYLLSTIVCSALNLTQLFDHLHVSSAIALSVTGGYVLSFVPTKALTKVNVTSNLVFIACCLMFIFTGIMLPRKAPASDLQFVKPHGLLSAAGILVFSPAGHSFYPRMMQQMQEPSKFPTCIRRAYLGAAIVYIGLAVPGYYMFGSATQPSAIRNIGVDLKLMPLPDLAWMNTAAALGLVMKLVPSQALVLSPLTAVINGVVSSKLSHASSEAMQPFVAPCVLLVSSILAAQFANEVALLLNLMGSFFCMNIAFVLPVICYWRLAPEPLGLGKQMLFVFLIAMGLTCSLLGIASCL